MCRTDKNQQRWKINREAQRRYKKEVRKVYKDSCRTFCSSINDLPMTTRLHRALSRDPKIKLGSLADLLGRRTQSEGETLEFLLVTRFPNLVVTEKETTPAAAFCTKRVAWWVAARVVTNTRVKWEVHSCAPYKIQEWLGYSQLFCKRDRGFESHTWSKSFMPAWQMATFQPRGARLRKC